MPLSLLKFIVFVAFRRPVKRPILDVARIVGGGGGREMRSRRKRRKRVGVVG